MSLFIGSTAFAAPYVTNVVAKQRYPWNGLVDVSYEIVGMTNGIDHAYGAGWKQLTRGRRSPTRRVRSRNR